ncbi:ribonucleases P/MRP protein subunit POP1 [Aplochiton taeniatus]
MSGAKGRMREKKMRNQPSNVYSSSLGMGGSGNRNGDGGTAHLGQGGKQENRGWVRGHQKGGHGYAQELPTIITASDFAKARSAEVKAMLKAVTRTTGSSHAFGALPKHMRRRAMSHNTKRLPCRLRESANRMLEKTQQAGKKAKKEQSKSKSRKARRRHGNLLLEFNRRQRKNVWLETHIWHAKRFHMVKKWGYKLGDRPTCKCYRACYRAMSSHSLLMDLSYYCCVELQGEEDRLLAALSQLTSKEAGPTFAAAVCLSGRRQGSVTVYRAGRYPSEPLGPVTFLWRPRRQDSNDRQLWIWLHPTLKQDLLPELQAVCCCSEPMFQPDAPGALPVPEPEPEPEPSPGPSTPLAPTPDPGRGLVKKPGVELKARGKRKRNSSAAAGEPPAKKILGDGTRSPMTPVSWKSSSTMIVINDLTMEMVRFRLIGPQSHSVLTETLEAATECDDLSKCEPSSLWWPSHRREEKNMHLHQQQADVFRVLKGIFSTGEVPSGSVLGLTVDDPRLTLPKKRGKAMPNLREAQDVDEDKRRELTLQGVPEHLCQSFLWDRSVRDNVTENKISERDLNRMKSELLVPGSRLKPTPPQGRVPLLLVQQPGKQVGQEMASWGAGWDLILPKGWGMAFWVPLIYRGVRVAGLRMSLKHSQNKGAPHFPHDYPDCPAGGRFQEEQERELLDKFKRRPPAKRTNYIKHGCLAPFCCPWQQLSEEWDMIVREGGEDREGVAKIQAKTVVQPLLPKKEEVTQQHGLVVTTQTHFTVLRNRKSLRLLSGWCRPTSSKGQRSIRPGAVPPLDHSSATSLLAAHGNSVVWVRLSLLSKGQPELHALVCVPTPEDLKLLRSDPKTKGPQEPLHRDHFKSSVRRGKKRQKKRKSSSISVFREKPSGKPSEPMAVSAMDTTPGPTQASSSTQAVITASPSTQAPITASPSAQAPITASPSAQAPITASPSAQGPGQTHVAFSTPTPGSTQDLIPASTSTQARSSDPITVPSLPPTPPDPTAAPPTSTPAPDTKPTPSSSSDLVLGLWPDPLPSVTSHCSRVTLGWVTQGDFSLSAGCGEALGFLSLPGLLHTVLGQLADQRGLVLLRNPSSLQYRFAKINIEV